MLKFMLDKELEQWINVKFLLELRKCVTKYFYFLTNMNRDHFVMSMCFWMTKKLNEEKRGLSKHFKNRWKSCKHLWSCWKWSTPSIRKITDMINIDKETVRQILHSKLNWIVKKQILNIASRQYASKPFLVKNITPVLFLFIKSYSMKFLVAMNWLKFGCFQR